MVSAYHAATNKTLRVFGVGCRPLGAARGRSPHFRCASDDGRKSIRCRRRSTVGRSGRPMTLQPQNAGQCGVCPSAAHSTVFREVFRIPVTTSGELILLPVWERHPKLNPGQRPFTRYSDSDIPPSSLSTFPAFRTFRVQNGG